MSSQELFASQSLAAAHQLNEEMEIERIKRVEFRQSDETVSAARNFLRLFKYITAHLLLFLLLFCVPNERFFRFLTKINSSLKDIPLTSL